MIFKFILNNNILFYYSQAERMFQLKAAWDFLCLYTSFKMAYWVSDYIDSIQKGIGGIYRNPVNLRNVPPTDNVVNAMLQEIVVG